MRKGQFSSNTDGNDNLNYRLSMTSKKILPSSDYLAYSNLTYSCLASHKRTIGKRCTSRSLRRRRTRRLIRMYTVCIEYRDFLKKKKHGNNKNYPDTPSAGNGPGQKSPLCINGLTCRAIWDTTRNMICGSFWKLWDDVITVHLFGNIHC